MTEFLLSELLPPALLAEILLPFLPALLCCILLETVFVPPVKPFARLRPCICTGHLAVLLLIYLLELAVFRRPWFAASQVVFWQGLMLVVNRVKLSQLYEPFVYQDLHYFVDIFKHPRLYLPFFGTGRLVLAVLVPGVLVFSALQLEPVLTERWDYLQFAAAWGLLLLLMCLSILFYWMHVSPLVGVDPSLDQAEMGMLGSFIAYAKAERRLALLAEPLQNMQTSLQQPHLVVVQSESFFDARRLWPDIQPGVYRWFDQLQQQSLYAGELTVPAVGANTLRSEFAFLTGLTDREQGIHRFNPYRRLARHPVSTLASRLKAQGYRTVCVHPYPISFYQRDRVYPHLGFDEFIDLTAFNHLSDSHFVGDIEVAAKVQSMIDAADVPTFVFVITMENHGPLHLEQVNVDEPARYLTALPPAMVSELTAYLRHIVNAGTMADMLCQTLQKSERGGLICWYGDHLPILPELYRAREFTSHKTDYFIWNSRVQGATEQRPHKAAHQLANLLLQQLSATEVDPDETSK